MHKGIKQITHSKQHHMVGDGFRVYNYFPNNEVSHQMVSPFLLLDYNAPYEFPPSSHKKGVGTHPHRGFETVTIVFDGHFEHKDSTGSGGLLEPGDVQWMTAASGILHNEFHQEEFSKKGGLGHMIQLWVNLPAKDKMSPPKYQNILSKNIPNIKLDDIGSYVRVIAGEFDGTKGAASTFTPINTFDLRLKKGAKIQLTVPESHQAMGLVTGGSFTVINTPIAHQDMVFFGSGGDTIELTATEDSMMLFLSGEPIDEPVASYGPFVMNTQKEIMAAIEDYNAGKFGSMN